MGKLEDRDPMTMNLSAWYEFGMKDATTLLIRIHQKAWTLVKARMVTTAPVVLHFQERFADNLDFKLFVEPNEKKSWGFGNALIPEKSKEKDWLGFTVPLPILFEKGNHTRNNEWALRATLEILFIALWLLEDDTKVERPQLMIVENLRVDMEIYGGALSVILTPAVARWLSRKEEESTLPEVEEAMQAAEHHMWRSKKYVLSRHDFRAHCRQPKWINFSVPGNACGLDPSDYYDKSPDHGYGLAPHNTDNGTQQLTLLVGLAKLQELVRKDFV